jgi:hypothetical protein
MRYVTSGPNHSETPLPQTDVKRTHAAPRRRLRVGRAAALALVATSLAIPAGAAAYYDGGGPASHAAPAPQFPTAKQIAQHRGTPPGAALTTSVPASDGNGDTVLILVASAALLGAIGIGAVAMARGARGRRSPQPGV